MQHPPELRSAGGLRWFGVTDRGKVRKNNEDAFLGVQFDAREFHYLGKLGEASLGHHDYAFAVSDGIGGNHAGEFASRVSVEKITRLLPKSYKQSAKGMEPGFPDVLTELYDQIHKALNFLSLDEETRGMGATLSLCWFTPGWMYWAHIGDSRIYYLPAEEGGIRQLSHDDTHVGWLFRNAKISEHQARTHPAKNQLQRALGAGHQFVDPQVGSVAYGKGDFFLICSDGVTDGLYDEHLLEILRPPPGEDRSNPAQRLVKESLERSGRDNTTAMVIEVV
jgi:protein phosphatase